MRKQFFATLLLVSASLFLTNVAAQPTVPDQPSAPLKERMRIFFAPNSSAIAGEGLATLQRAVETAAAVSLLRIKIVGHADRMGATEDNVRLAQERADHVAAALKEAQVPEGAIDPPVSRGSDEPLTTNKKALHLNRRVEISIYGIPRLETGVTP